MSTLNTLPTLDDLLYGDPRKRRRPHVPQMIDDLDPFAPGPGTPGLSLPDFGAAAPQPPSYPRAAAPAPQWANQPQGIERRGEHPKLRALVDAGPDAVEAEIREFLRQAPPEAVEENPRAWWQTALEYLDLPRNAVFNLVNNAFGAPIQPSSKETFKGLRKIYGADLLRTMGWRPDSTIGKVGQFLAGLAIDFVSDPLTYLSGLGGVARGTTLSAAKTAEELAVDTSRALRAGQGLTLAGRHVRPGALDRLGELARIDEAFLPEVARAAEFPSSVERAAAQLPAADLYDGRWGLGVSTILAKTTPVGHLVAGPAILAGKAGGALVEGAGRIAQAIPVVGPVVGRPIELLGRGIQIPADLLGAASDAIGTPLRGLPSKTAFKPFREMAGVSDAISAIEAAIGASPAAQRLLGQAGRAGAAITEAAGKIGIGQGSKLQQLVKRFVQDAELQRRRTEAEFQQEFGPLIERAARETGIAKEHLEPLYSLMQEFGGQIETAARSGSEAELRSVLDAQEAAVREHLSRNYPQAKVAKATDEVLGELRKRVRVAAPARLTGSQLRQQIRAVLPGDEETDAVMAVVKARAAAAGESLDDYVGRRIGGVVRGRQPGAGALEQGAPENTGLFGQPLFEPGVGEQRALDFGGEDVTVRPEAAPSNQPPPADAAEAAIRRKFKPGREATDVLFQAAYHGSPHTFDRFSTERIGTGEGAQAYGWGLYFAGEKGVAEHYRDALSRRPRYFAGNRAFAAGADALRSALKDVGIDLHPLDAAALESQLGGESLASLERWLERWPDAAARVFGEPEKVRAALAIMDDVSNSDLGREFVLRPKGTTLRAIMNDPSPENAPRRRALGMNELQREFDQQLYKQKKQGAGKRDPAMALAAARDEINKQRAAVAKNLARAEEEIAAGGGSSGLDVDNLRRRTQELEDMDWWVDRVVPADMAYVKGRLYEVDLKPAEGEWLLHDEPMRNQSAAVRQALADLGLPTVEMKIPSLKRALYLFRTQRVQADAASDIGVRANLRKGYNLAKAGDEKGFRSWFVNEGGSWLVHDWPQGNTLDEAADGARAYTHLAAEFRRQPEAPANAYQMASKALQARGVRGIKYRSGDSRDRGFTAIFKDEAAAKRFRGGDQAAQAMLQEAAEAVDINHGQVPAAIEWLDKQIATNERMRRSLLTLPHQPADDLGYYREIQHYRHARDALAAGDLEITDRRKFNYVVFDDADVEIVKMEQAKKGAIEFAQDNRAIIHAFESADVSTMVHELGHVFRRDLAGDEARTALDWASTTGRWDRDAEEKFARGFERYLRDGTAPTPGLGTIFAKFKRWLSTIYAQLTGSPIDVKISEPMRTVYDRLLTPAATAAPVEGRGGLLQAVHDLNLPGTSAGRHSMAYKAGITGNQREARVYADETLTADHVAELRKKVGDGAATVFIPMPSTSGSGNAVPKAIAEKLAKELGGTVAEGLLSSGTQQSRRSKNLLAALANPRNIVAAESYDLPPGARLILVDDVARSGGTLRDATQALAEAGYKVEAAVAGKVRRTTALTPTRTQLMEIRQRAKGDLDRLESALQRPVDALTGEEATTLLRELRKPGASGRGLALQIERLREVPLPAAGRPAKPGTGAARASRADVERQLLGEYDHLKTAGLVTDIEGENVAAAARVGDVEQPLASGYTFSHTMRGEAAELRADLRGRGYAHLARRVKTLKRGAPSGGGNLGDDALASLREAGETDPLTRMADAIIAHHNEATQTGRLRQAIEWIEANPEQATPLQKDLLRRYAAFTGAPESRAAARGKVGETVAAEDLAVGDRLTVAGEPAEVVAAGPDGVRIKDGVDIELQPGEPIVVDRGSHEPDPLPAAVAEAVAKIRGEGGKPNVKTVIGAIRESLPDGPGRDREWKRILGLEKLKGNRLAIESKVEVAMLRAGEGARGAAWESILRRLEDIEQGRAGRFLAKIESPSHPLGAFIQARPDPVTGAATGAQELTDLGQAALRSMRANLAAGGEPGQVGRIIERLNGLEAQRMMAKRAGSPVPRGISQEIAVKRAILGRMGRTVEDDIAVQSARSAAEAAGPGTTTAPLPVPKPRDLFVEPVAAIVERMESLRVRTEADEAAKLATGRLSTERSMGYFPRILGPAKSFAGKMNRLNETKWRKEWERAAESIETPEVGITARKGVYDNLLAVIRAENKGRARRGEALIAEPAETDDLARSVADILERYQDTLTAGHRFQLRRTFLREAMLHEVNSLAEATGTSFQTDPVGVWLKRRIASHYAIAGADFLEAAIKDAVANGWGVEIKGKGPVPRGFARITDQRFGALAGGWAFKEELVKEFKKFTRTMDRPHLLLRGLDWATSQWRTGVLGVLPYTMTNLLSGIFQANQFDAFSQKSWGAAKRFMEDIHAGRYDAPMRRYVKDLPAEMGDLTAREFYNALSIEHGALGKGLYGVELEGDVTNQMRTGWSVVDAVRSTAVGESRGARALAALTGLRHDPLTGRIAWDLSEQAYFKGFRAANVAVEDWMKIGFVLERVKRGDTLADAVQKGRLALNQSADLTDFEKATFRRMLPFWGWMKGNAVLQFHMAVARPQIAALVPKIRGDLEASFAGDETLPPSARPRHVAEELGTQLSGGVKPDFLNLTRLFPVKELGTTPFAGLTGAVASAAETALQGLNPLAKQPLEATVNRDFYWDRPLTEFEGQTRRFLGMNLSPQVKRVLAALRPLNVVEQVSWRGVPGNFDDAAFTAAQVAGVRTFPVDVRRQIFEAERTINDQLAAVMRDFSRARQRADDAGRDWRSDGEVRRLAEVYRALREKRDSLPLKAIRGGSTEARRASRERREELRQFALAG